MGDGGWGMKGKRQKGKGKRQKAEDASSLLPIPLSIRQKSLAALEILRF
jgi:hypothetical protein